MRRVSSAGANTGSADGRGVGRDELLRPERIADERVHRRLRQHGVADGRLRDLAPERVVEPERPERHVGAERVGDPQPCGHGLEARVGQRAVGQADPVVEQVHVRGQALRRLLHGRDERLHAGVRGAAVAERDLERDRRVGDRHAARGAGPDARRRTAGIGAGGRDLVDGEGDLPLQPRGEAGARRHALRREREAERARGGILVRARQREREARCVPAQVGHRGVPEDVGRRVLDDGQALVVRLDGVGLGDDHHVVGLVEDDVRIEADRPGGVPADERGGAAARRALRAERELERLEVGAAIDERQARGGRKRAGRRRRAHERRHRAQPGRRVGVRRDDGDEAVGRPAVDGRMEDAGQRSGDADARLGCALHRLLHVERHQAGPAVAQPVDVRGALDEEEAGRPAQHVDHGRRRCSRRPPRGRSRTRRRTRSASAARRRARRGAGRRPRRRAAAARRRRRTSGPSGGRRAAAARRGRRATRRRRAPTGRPGRR